MFARDFSMSSSDSRSVWCVQFAWQSLHLPFLVSPHRVPLQFLDGFKGQLGMLLAASVKAIALSRDSIEPTSCRFSPSAVGFVPYHRKRGQMHLHVCHQTPP